MTLFRPQRGSLDAAMAEVRKVATRAELATLLHAPEDWISVEPYGGVDKRIGWDTYIVTVRGQGVGFTNGPLPKGGPDL